MRKRSKKQRTKIKHLDLIQIWFYSFASTQFKAMAYKGISEENTAMDEEQHIPFLPPIDHPGRTSENTKQIIRPDYLKIAMYGLLGLSAMLIIGGSRSKPTFEKCVKHLHEWCKCSWWIIS